MYGLEKMFMTQSIEINTRFVETSKKINRAKYVGTEMWRAARWGWECTKCVAVCSCYIWALALKEERNSRAV
jgi:hypothetical protein